MVFDLMYDGIDVGAWPADCRFGLCYTDGRYANLAAARARFPQAVFQTISAVGLVVADWIDCEPGCVWPPSQAVALYSQWRGHGCRGIYMSEANKPGVKTALQVAGVTCQLFGADWTGIPHINGDETQTQYLMTAGYDVTAIPAAVPSAPVPVPVPQLLEADLMFVAVSTGPASAHPQQVIEPGVHYLIYGGAVKYVIESPADLAGLTGKLGVPVELSCSFLANIPDMP